MQRQKKGSAAKGGRGTFNAISKSAVTEAMKKPRGLDEDLIDAYRARRALDYLVGFTLSPVLWRKLPGAKSAGRVQSVTLRHQAAVAAEASSLLGWIKKGVVRSGADLTPISFQCASDLAAGSFDLQFTYADPKKNFHWSADLEKKEAVFDGDLGSGHTTLTVGAQLLIPELMLSEAMFF